MNINAFWRKIFELCSKIYADGKRIDENSEVKDGYSTIYYGNGLDWYL